MSIKLAVISDEIYTVVNDCLDELHNEHNYIEYIYIDFYASVINFFRYNEFLDYDAIALIDDISTDIYNKDYLFSDKVEQWLKSGKALWISSGSLVKKIYIDYIYDDIKPRFERLFGIVGATPDAPSSKVYPKEGNPIWYNSSGYIEPSYIHNSRYYNINSNSEPFLVNQGKIIGNYLRTQDYLTVFTGFNFATNYHEDDSVNLGNCSDCREAFKSIIFYILTYRYNFFDDIHLKAANVPNGVKLQWNIPTDIADSITLYRKEDNLNYTKILTTNDRTTSYTDTDVNYGKKYTYYVEEKNLVYTKNSSEVIDKYIPTFLFRESISGGIEGDKFHFRDTLIAGMDDLSAFKDRLKLVSFVDEKPFNFRQRISASLPVDKIISYWDRFQFIPIAVSTIFPYVYVVDSGNNRVQAFTYKGDFVFSFGEYGSGEGQFDNPYGIANDDKYLYVTDSGNNRIEAFDFLGNYKFQFVDDLDNPTGIAVNGNFLIVADTNNDRVIIFLREGLVPVQIISYVSGKELDKPTIVSSIDEGVIEFYDSGNDRNIRLKLKSYDICGILSDINLPKIKGEINSRSINLNSSMKFNIDLDIKVEDSYFIKINTTLPKFKAYLTTGNSLRLMIPNKLKAHLNIISGGVLDISTTLPSLYLDSLVKTGNTVSLNLKLQNIKSNTKIISGIGSNITSLLKLPKSFVSLSQGNLSRLVSSITVPLVSFSGHNDIISSIKGEIPSLKLILSLSEIEELLGNAVVLHTSLDGVTEYSEFDFNSGIVVDDTLILASKDGLYALDIDGSKSYVEFPILDIRNNVMAIPVEVFINGEHDKMKLKYTLNKDTDLLLNIENYTYNIRETRVKLPKGVKDKFVSFGIDNSEGKEMKLDSIRILGYSINRRRR